MAVDMTKLSKAKEEALRLLMSFSGGGLLGQLPRGLSALGDLMTDDDEKKKEQARAATPETVPGLGATGSWAPPPQQQMVAPGMNPATDPRLNAVTNPLMQMAPQPQPPMPMAPQPRPAMPMPQQAPRGAMPFMTPPAPVPQMGGLGNVPPGYGNIEGQVGAAKKPGFMEGLTNFLQGPTGQLALSMLSQSGPQPGDPSFGARLGKAGLGFAGTQFEQKTTTERQDILKKELEQRNKDIESLIKTRGDQTDIAREQNALNKKRIEFSMNEARRIAAMKFGKPFQVPVYDAAGKATGQFHPGLFQEGPGGEIKQIGGKATLEDILAATYGAGLRGRGPGLGEEEQSPTSMFDSIMQ